MIRHLNTPNIGQANSCTCLNPISRPEAVVASLQPNYDGLCHVAVQLPGMPRMAVVAPVGRRGPCLQLRCLKAFRLYK